MSSLYEVGSQRVPKMLDSIGFSKRFSFKKSSPTSRFFSFGPCFVSSSTVRSNQSSINSSYLNQDVDPSKVVEICVVIPVHAE